MNPELPVFFDTHAHLDFPDFQEDLPQVIERATAQGIRRIFSIGTDLVSSGRAIQLAEQHPNVFAVAGWHPCHVEEAPEDIRPELRRMAKHPKVVAIGESGLDYHRLPAEGGPEGGGAVEALKARQAALFRQQLEVAADSGLNCMIHQRDALEDTLRILAPFAGRVRGQFHCFVDGPEAMRRIVDMGSVVSFTGIITFKNAATVRETAAAVPADAFLLETDCPYLAPVPDRGKRCEPAHVRAIAAKVAEVRGCSLEALSEATCATALAFFPRLTLD
ncbi:MAG TPA: TatD family hydrolase [Methylomirabilota bacterium]|nr:TatD family hydrolase [Methylomirabilota bacterium]